MKLLRLHRFIWLAVTCVFAHGPAMAAAAAFAGQPGLVYIGTYTGPRSLGIYVSRFDPATGKLNTPELAAETKNPAFLAVHPSGRFLYSIGELTDASAKRPGAVTAFSIDGTSGKLTQLNQQPSGGVGPCHLAVDGTGKCLLVANYGSGSIESLPIQPAGRLGEPSATIQHQGSSVNPQRQAGPHAHFITPDPGNRFALVCDLGLDKVLTYRLDAARGTLTAQDPPAVTVKAGSGPRHLAFHPDGRHVYLISEIGSTLAAFDYDAKRGALKQLQMVSTLPEKFEGHNGCAEVQVHPSGKFVYGSNRGHDSIVIFAVDPKSGRLTYVGHQPSGGKTPRHFVFDPTGQWLLAENQDSNNIVVFKVDPKTGLLTAFGQAVEVGAPVCAVFVPTSS